MKFLNIPFIPTSLSTFFKSKIFSTIEYREKENKSRTDMIQLLLDARKAHPEKCIFFLKMSNNFKSNNF
jgi:hypothetical protein